MCGTKRKMVAPSEVEKVMIQSTYVRGFFFNLVLEAQGDEFLYCNTVSVRPKKQIESKLRTQVVYESDAARSLLLLIIDTDYTIE